VDLHPNYQPEDGNEAVVHLAEVEDRFAAADLLRRRVMPTLDREIAIGVAHAIVSAWNSDRVAAFLSGRA
jgi:hypothetical protein